MSLSELPTDVTQVTFVPHPSPAASRAGKWALVATSREDGRARILRICTKSENTHPAHYLDRYLPGASGEYASQAAAETAAATVLTNMGDG